MSATTTMAGALRTVSTRLMVSTAPAMLGTVLGPTIRRVMTLTNVLPTMEVALIPAKTLKDRSLALVILGTLLLLIRGDVEISMNVWETMGACSRLNARISLVVSDAAVELDIQDHRAIV